MHDPCPEDWAVQGEKSSSFPVLPKGESETQWWGRKVVMSRALGVGGGEENSFKKNKFSFSK